MNRPAEHIRWSAFCMGEHNSMFEIQQKEVLRISLLSSEGKMYCMLYSCTGKSYKKNSSRETTSEY